MFSVEHTYFRSIEIISKATLFSTSFELQSVNLTMCVCIPKTLRQPREVKNGLIMLKFDTLVDWMNT